MKFFPTAFALVGLLGAGLGMKQSNHRQTLIVAGDFLGSLEPCGCTSPQIGGLKRLGSLIAKERKTSEATVVINGALTTGLGPQSLMKLETIALAAKAWGVAAVNLSGEDTGLGPASVLTFSNLAPGVLISGSANPSEALTFQPFVPNGGFLIGGASIQSSKIAIKLHTTSVALESYLNRLEMESSQDDLSPLLLLDGNLDDATKIARAHPKLSGIVFRSVDTPSSQIIWVGKTALVTGGPQGKYAVEVSIDDGHFTAAKAVPLGPDFMDDPETASFYRSYLKRVSDSHLLEGVHRTVTIPYVGSQKCRSCHEAAFRVWEKSKHSHAYQTLQTVQHGRDPDCVSCHVVGLNALSGFKSAVETPQMANVGCESCHGPGGRHIQRPTIAPLAKIDSRKCSSCHTAEQDPNFNSLTFKSRYWPLIRH